MIQELWEYLAKFTPEARQAALAACAKYAINQDSGIISFDESYNNLIWCANTLRDAIEKKKLIQLPITIQKELLETTAMISANHDAVLRGEDVVAALIQHIEKLFTIIWQYGLNHLTDELMGFQTKLNQIKQIELSLTQTKEILEDGIRSKAILDKIINEVREQYQDIQSRATSATAELERTTQATDQIEEKVQEVVVAVNVINSHKTSAIDGFDSVQDSKKSAASDAQEIHEMVAAFTKLTEELIANKNTQKDLFNEFEKYREKIDGLLADSNRTGMAASFTNRRLWLIAPLAGWLAVFGLSIWGLWYIGDSYIAPILKGNSAIHLEQLPLRLALTAPLIWLGWFSARQYGFTTRLREDYAYKEASAKSFEGYKREANGVDPEMLKKLLDQAINNLGDNPIRIYDAKNNHSSPAHEIFDGMIKDDKAISRLKELVSIFKS